MIPIWNNIEKPKQRGRLRQIAGREYYILKRKLQWALHAPRYASRKNDPACPHSVITHKSLLLRPLKGVDMYLQHNKVTNLRLAAERLDGIVIGPGETLSVWKQVGRPCKRRGYLEGLVLHNGQITTGTGGGLCQLGNLLYWMALHTELDVTERWRHSFDVFPDVNRTIPFGCGATLAYNYIDLQLTNPTPYNYSVRLWLDEIHLHGEVRCSRELPYRYEVYETDHQIRRTAWGGYSRHNRIWKRRTKLGSGELQETLAAENHAIMMYNPLLEESRRPTEERG